MITIEGLHKKLGDDDVLCGVDLEVDRGEVVAIVGPSGTGKSTLLRHVIGLAVPDRGDVRVDGRSVCRADDRELARLRQRMGYAFQDGALLDSLTVRENLRLALDDRACAREPSHADTRIGDAIERVQLDSDVLDKRPPELSGGMKKRVGVARAILNRPEVLLFDEPTSGLDPQNVRAIHEMILDSRSSDGSTALLVTHDLPTLPEFADRVVVLLRGKVHFDGCPHALFSSPDLRIRAFIGRSTRQREEVLA